ncbi:MAG: hypothetical protein IJ086_03685 [Clostridium sp.]|nr:hypothetical protein [Clostridium sp.]
MNRERLEKSKKDMIKSMYEFLDVLYEEGANLINYPSYLPSFDEFICELEEIDVIDEGDLF